LNPIPSLVYSIPPVLPPVLRPPARPPALRSLPASPAQLGPALPSSLPSFLFIDQCALNSAAPARAPLVRNADAPLVISSDPRRPALGPQRLFVKSAPRFPYMPRAHIESSWQKDFVQPRLGQRRSPSPAGPLAARPSSALSRALVTPQRRMSLASSVPRPRSALGSHGAADMSLASSVPRPRSALGSHGPSAGPLPMRPKSAMPPSPLQPDPIKRPQTAMS
jgi:hypothetical protein